MEKKKQIEEMGDIMINHAPCTESYDVVDYYAEILYEAGYHKQEWISVEERLPKKSGDYLVHVQNGLIIALHYSDKNEAFNAHDSLDHCDYAISVTHWMPLPEPPKGVVDGKAD